MGGRFDLALKLLVGCCRSTTTSLAAHGLCNVAGATALTGFERLDALVLEVDALGPPSLRPTAPKTPSRLAASSTIGGGGVGGGGVGYDRGRMATAAATTVGAMGRCDSKTRVLIALRVAVSRAVAAPAIICIACALCDFALQAHGGGGEGKRRRRGGGVEGGVGAPVAPR